MTHVEFSVVVPCYNRGHVLTRALDSVLEQSYPPAEVVVVDDGSSDSTAGLVQGFYPEITYAYQRHCGVSAARNHGISLTCSRWIAFLDSDDAWEKDKLAAQARFIEKTPDVRLVHTNERWIRNGQPLQQKAHHKKRGGDIFIDCLSLCVISPSAVVIARDLLNEVGVFDERLKACEDYDLWLRICAREHVGFIDSPLTIKYGGHSDQLSRTVPALDRYRIGSIIALIRSGVLNQGQHLAALNTLNRKIEVYAGGAKKRGRHNEARYLERTLEDLNGHA